MVKGGSFDEPRDSGGRHAQEFFRVLKQEYTVGISFHYKPVYEWKIFQDAGYGPENTPIAARVCRQLFQIPVFYHMTEDDYRYIAWAIKETIAAVKK